MKLWSYLYKGSQYENKSSHYKYNTDGLVQDCSNSSALAMELLQSCTEPSIRYDDCLVFIMVIPILPITWKDGLYIQILPCWDYEYKYKTLQWCVHG